MRTLVHALVAAIVALAAGRADAQDARNGAPAAYRIGPEDTLTISVWNNDAISRTVPVRPDGMISLPLVNDVRSFKVSVLGEVQRASRYELKSWTTVLDVLAMAGGFDEFAARTRSRTTRCSSPATSSLSRNGRREHGRVPHV
jgi:protein involved in polysaccharide export with SLBB domain